MAITAASIIADIKVLLNDPAGTNYTSAKLLPHLNRAYKSLQSKMRLAGMQSSKEISAEISVAAGTTRLGDAAGLPNDFLSPVMVYTRDNASQKWAPLSEFAWEGIGTSSSRLEGWAYREDEIKFKGATAAQTLLLKYNKAFQIIDEETDPILIVGAELYLVFKAGAYAAMFIGENQTRAAALDGQAQEAWDDFKGSGVKQGQRRPVRRRVNRFRR